MRGDSEGKARFPVGCGPGVLWPGPCTVRGRDGPESGCSPLGTPDFPGGSSSQHVKRADFVRSDLSKSKQKLCTIV